MIRTKGSNTNTGFGFETQKFFKLSAKWASKPFCCTVEHIQKKCRGACCFNNNNNFWPGNSSGKEDCFYHSETGCTLSVDDRPIACLLFPLRIHSSGLIRMYHRALFTKGICKGAYRVGNMLIEEMGWALRSVFGDVVYEQAVLSVKKGKDFIFPATEQIQKILKYEEYCEKNKVPPTPRRKIIAMD